MANKTWLGGDQEARLPCKRCGKMVYRKSNLDVSAVHCVDCQERYGLVDSSTPPPPPPLPAVPELPDHVPPPTPTSGLASRADTGFFAPERRGIAKGAMGGVLMMVIAVVWFGAGYAAGYIFYYPPILFLFGLFGLIKGLATGNLTGKQR